MLSPTRSLSTKNCVIILVVTWLASIMIQFVMMIVMLKQIITKKVIHAISNMCIKCIIVSEMLVCILMVQKLLLTYTVPIFKGNLGSVHMYYIVGKSYCTHCV